MENIEKIREFMKSHKDFEEQPDTNGRRYHFMKDGEKHAYIWFKWALNGWNAIIGNQKERHNIESVEQLKSLLSL